MAVVEKSDDNLQMTVVGMVHLVRIPEVDVGNSSLIYLLLMELEN